MRLCYVYILYSERLKKYYKGHSYDVSRRLYQHNSGESNFTRLGIPWVMILSLKKDSKQEAIELEQKLKNLNQQRLIDFINKNKQDHSL